MGTNVQKTQTLGDKQNQWMIRDIFRINNYGDTCYWCSKFEEYDCCLHQFFLRFCPCQFIGKQGKTFWYPGWDRGKEGSSQILTLWTAAAASEQTQTSPFNIIIYRYYTMQSWQLDPYLPTVQHFSPLSRILRCHLNVPHFLFFVLFFLIVQFTLSLDPLWSKSRK